MASVKSEEQLSNLASDSQSQHFNNKDIFLQSESEKSNSQSNSSNEFEKIQSKKQIVDGLELLKKRLAVPASVEKFEKQSFSSGRRATKKNQSQLSDTDMKKSVKFVEEFNSQREFRNEEEKKQEQQGQIVMYSHFKISKDFSYAQCIYCQHKFVFDRGICVKSNNHMAEVHPNKLNSHISNNNDNEKNQQFKPKLQQVDFIFLKFLSPKNRKSSVWEKFMYNQEYRFAICRICKMAFSVRDGTTTGMIKHLTKEENQPNQQSKDQRRETRIEDKAITVSEQQPKKKRKYTRRSKLEIASSKIQDEKNNEQEERRKQEPSWISIMYQQKPSTSTTYIINLIQRKGLATYKDAKKAVETFHWSKQTKYLQLFHSLRKHSNYFLDQIIMQELVSSVRVYSTQMEQAMKQLGDCLSIWIVTSQIQDDSLKEFIFFTVQNRNAQPFVVGLAVVFRNDQLSYRLMLQRLFCNRYSPLTISVSGKCPSIILFQKCTQEFLKQRRMRTNMVAFQFPENLKDWDSLIIMKAEKFKNCYFGLLFSKRHLKFIQLLMKSNGPSKQSVASLLVQFLRKNACLHQFLNQYKEISKQEQYKAEAFYLSNFYEDSLVTLHAKLQNQVFFKVLLSYIFGKFKTCIVSQKRTQTSLSFTVSSSSDSYFCNSGPSTAEVTFIPQSNSWRCSCRILVQVGLPCQHIMHIIGLYGGSALFYLNSRWTRQKKQRNYPICVQDIYKSYIPEIMKNVDKFQYEDWIMR